MAKINVQQMNVSLDKPPTDRDFLIFRTTRANPKVCTVPERVKISENSPSLKTKYRVRMIPARTAQYAASYFLKIPIIVKTFTFQCFLQIKMIYVSFKYSNLSVFRMQKIIFLLFVSLVISNDPSLPGHSLPIYGNASLGYYYVTIFVGHPPQKQSVIIDTGSGQLALPCNKCTSCNPKHIDTPFDMKKSKTAEYLTCESNDPQCKRCTSKSPTQSCKFMVSYAEGSSLQGIIIKDSIQFESFSEGQEIVTAFGCTTQQTNLFLRQQANGIFGLTPIRTSRLLQDLYEKHHGYSGQELQFSICLARNGGLMTIGKPNTALHSSDQSVKTTYSDQRTLYSLNKVGSIKIGDSFIHKGQDKLGMFGLFIDSGSTFTYFPRQNYLIFKNQLIESCNSNKQKCQLAVGQSIVCFHLKGTNDILESTQEVFKPVVFQVAGKEIKWGPTRYFLLRDKANRQVCLAVQALDRYLLGANWMVNRDIVFNLKEKTVEIFSQAKCSSSPTIEENMSQYTNVVEGNKPLNYDSSISEIVSSKVKNSEFIFVIGIIFVVIGVAGLFIILLKHNDKKDSARHNPLSSVQTEDQIEISQARNQVNAR